MSDKTINEWTAEKCGITNLSAEDKWNFRDPRCMAKIEIALEIETNLSRGFYVGWTARTVKFKPKENEPYKIYEGETPMMAKLNCVIKLYEAEHE